MNSSILKNLDDLIEYGSINQIERNSLIKYIESLDFSWHPLGFINVLLFQDENMRYRVHIWLPNLRLGKTPELPIHNHVFKLKSRVLLGSLQNIEYKLVNGSSYNFNTVIYDPNESSSVNITNLTTDIEITTNKTYSAGEIYTVEKNIFHESIVKINSSAITFTKMIDFSRETHPIVLSPSNIKFSVSKFTSTKVDNLIKNLSLKLIKDTIEL